MYRVQYGNADSVTPQRRGARFCNCIYFFALRDGNFIQTPLEPPFDALQSYDLSFSNNFFFDRNFCSRHGRTLKTPVISTFLHQTVEFFV